MKLIIIGSGSGMPVANRRSPSYWIEADDTNVLLDCGDGCSSGILSAQLDPLTLDAIAITHTHSDHWAGFPLLVQMFHILGRKNPLTIITPSEASDTFQRILETSYMWAEKIGFEIVWKIWREKIAEKIGSLYVKPYLNSHLQGYSDDNFRHPHSFRQCYSLEVARNGERGVYSSDIGSLSDLDEMLEKDADWLLIEGMHYPIEDFQKWISEKNIGKTIITHIPPERYGKKFADGTIIAEDGMTITF